MKDLTHADLVQISGGKCFELYNADVPLTYLPIVAAHIKLINKHQFDPNALLQDLQAAGLDPSQVILNVSVYC